MNKKEEQDENTIKDFAEKLQLVSNTKIVTKEESLNKLTAKEVVKTKMLNIAGDVFIEYEKELDERHRKMKSYEKYVRDNIIKNNVWNKLFACDMWDKINSEKNESFEDRFVDRFIKVSNNNKREIHLKKIW